jgi:hypothetical protein
MFWDGRPELVEVGALTFVYASVETGLNRFSRCVNQFKNTSTSMFVHIPFHPGVGEARMRTLEQVESDVRMLPPQQQEELRDWLENLLEDQFKQSNHQLL